MSSVRPLRLVSVLCVALLAVATLTACQTRAGAAAFVGKTRISETTVNRYLARDAATSTDSSTGEVDNPKSDVLTTLIRTALLDELFPTIPGSHPTAGELDAGRTKAMSALGITSLGQLEQEAESGGYTKAYAAVFLDEQTKVTVLTTLLKDPGDGSVITPAVTKLHAKISVSPRYGTWQDSNLSVGAGPAVPSFLQLSSGGAAAVNATG